MSPHPITTSVRGASTLFGVSPASIWLLLKEGRLRRLRLGRRTLVSVAELEALLEGKGSTSSKVRG